MRICFFADGESFHTNRWCRHFQEIGHEVHLITFKKVVIPNIHVHAVDSGNIRVKGGNGKVLLKFPKVKKIVRQIEPDIFHALYATSYGITGAFCKYHPYIITALGSDILVTPKGSWLMRKLLLFSFKKADLLTVMADHMKTASINIGANPDKIMVLPFGIDPKVFNAENKEIEKEFFTITSTRNLEPIYNIPHIIKAIAMAKNRIPNLRLNIIGWGSLQDELELLVKELELENVVSFIGRVDQYEMATYLKQSHVFVSTSLSDGNNISLNEAMACETFCIASNIPANTQWIDHGQNGFLVEIDDVEKLASYFVEVHANYELLQNKAVPISRVKLQEKGIWSNNMDIMEKEYKRLASIK